MSQVVYVCLLYVHTPAYVIRNALAKYVCCPCLLRYTVRTSTCIWLKNLIAIRFGSLQIEDFYGKLNQLTSLGVGDHIHVGP